MRTIVQNTTERIYFETLEPKQSAIDITIDIIDSGGTVIFTSLMAELGSSGIYFVDITLATAGDYVMKFTSPDLLNPESDHIVVVDSADSVIDVVKEILTILGQVQLTTENIDVCVAFMKKVCMNRVLIDETTNELIVFEDDSVTPLITFPLKDINGAPTSTSIFETLKGIL